MIPSDNHERQLYIAIRLHAGILANPKTEFGFDEYGNPFAVIPDILAPPKFISPAQLALSQATLLMARWNQIPI